MLPVSLMVPADRWLALFEVAFVLALVHLDMNLHVAFQHPSGTGPLLRRWQGAQRSGWVRITLWLCTWVGVWVCVLDVRVPWWWQWGRRW